MSEKASADPPPASPPPGRGRHRQVQYKGADLEAERGPGLGCFWIQVALLVVLVIATPLSVNAGLPPEVSAVLLFVTIGLLLLSGQTIIFLLRLVAADRRGRRRPLASATKTVGELEDERRAGTEPAPDGGTAPDDETAPDGAPAPDGGTAPGGAPAPDGAPAPRSDSAAEGD